MSDRSHFDAWLKKADLPARFLPEAFSQGTVNLFRQRADRAAALIQAAKLTFPKLPSIDYDVVHATGIGAWAFGPHARPCIGYACGNEWFLLLLFNRMLAEPGIFLDVGNPSCEIGNLPRITGVIGNPDMETMGSECLHITEPQDVERRQLAIVLRHFVAEFILMHELGHIGMGHLVYIKQYLNVPFLSDPGVPRGEKEIDLVWQTLELYTDNWAASFQLRMLIHRVGESEKLPKPWNEFYRDPKSALYYWTFALYIFTRLFGDDRLVPANLGLGTHPPWRFRLRQVGSAVLTSLKHWDLEGLFGTEDEVKVQLNKCANDVEEVMALITDAPYSIEGLIDGNSAAVREYKDNLMRIWKEDLRPKLVPFSYVPLGV